MKTIINITTSVLLILLGAMLIQFFELKIINIAYAMYIVLFVLILKFILKFMSMIVNER